MTLCNLMGFSLALYLFGVSVLHTVECTCTALPVRYIYQVASRRFTCQATGAEPIKYEWRRKTEKQPWKKMESDVDHTVIGGVLTFTYPIRRWDEGIYECIATNDQEVAVSRIEIQYAFIDPFSYAQIIRETARVGDYKTIECKGDPRANPPTSRYWWETLVDLSTDTSRSVHGEAYSVDLKGTLHMLNVRMEDASYNGNNGKGFYACSAFNSPSRGSMRGSFTTLAVLNSDRAPYRPPTIKYVSDDVDMEIAWNTKKDFILMCIGDGSPNIPKIHWRRHGKDMAKLEEYKDRITFGDYGRKITISNVQDNDTGYYECYIEGNTDIYKKIRVTVRNCDMPRPLHVLIGS